MCHAGQVRPMSVTVIAYGGGFFSRVNYTDLPRTKIFAHMHRTRTYTSLRQDSDLNHINTTDVDDMTKLMDYPK